ncbi:hypothetical protein PFISCL1PPCAC_27923 [Pristionchus fissidentatus]|uniref:F-box domain-containing protein n=1 Tax=Pristionchus fissidentatus TaxID=1538716 RepID=A0AAV5WX24_9BILA|nr:hypothetical protein PFISCL1PPCAC_27923 [Pristionchus fissidentatus]
MGLDGGNAPDSAMEPMELVPAAVPDSSAPSCPPVIEADRIEGRAGEEPMEVAPATEPVVPNPMAPVAELDPAELVVAPDPAAPVVAPEPTGPNLFDNVPDEVLLLMFSFLEGGKWQKYSAIKTIGWTCRRFRNFVRDSKNLKLLPNLRIDISVMTIDQSSVGCGIGLFGSSGNTFVTFNYANGRRSRREEDYGALRIGLKSELGMPEKMKGELASILRRYRPRRIRIGNTHLSQQLLVEIDSALSEVPKKHRELHFSCERYGVQIQPAHLVELVSHFEELHNIPDRFLTEEVVQSFLSDKSFDSYQVFPEQMSDDMRNIRCFDISMRNFANMLEFVHLPSTTTLTQVLDAVEARTGKLKWKVGLSCDETTITDVLREKATPLGYTITTPNGRRSLERGDVRIHIEHNRILQRFVASAHRFEAAY